MVAVEQALLITAVLLLLAVLASKASTRLGVPALLVFLVLGMLAGSEGPGGIPFDNARLAQSVGVVALAFILFSGGLETSRTAIAPVFWKGFRLSTLGVLLTALAVGGFTHLLLGLPLTQAVLLGAIVSSTDAAAVFSILRAKNVSLKDQVRPLLELESGSNDPMAVFLTLGLVRLAMNPGEGVLSLAPLFALQMAIGGGGGLAMGKLMVWVINRLKLEAEGLYLVVTIAAVGFTYGATTLLKGNGFLAVYVAGIVAGNASFVHKRSLILFHNGLAWLMQIAMFLTLGLLVFPSHLAPIAGRGLLVAAFLMFVARPAGVFLSLLFAGLPLRQQALVAWVGLRGAVPIILATFPLLAGVSNAELYFNLVFFIVLTSVLLQGTTIPLVARWLRLDAPLAPKRQYPLEFVPTPTTTSDMVQITVPPGSPAAGRQIVNLGLPPSALIVLIDRDENFLSPRGATVVEAGDTLLVLADEQDIGAVRAIIQPPGGASRG